MTDTMTCDRFADRLMAYLEHDTDEPTRVALERHAVRCDTCGPLLADLRKLRIDAANLPELAPSRDLWEGIAARIEAPVVPLHAVADAGPKTADVAATRTLPGTTRPGMRYARLGMMAASLAGAVWLGYAMRGNPTGDAVPQVAMQAPDVGELVPDTAGLPAMEPGTQDEAARGAQSPESGVSSPAATRTPTSPARAAAAGGQLADAGNADTPDAALVASPEVRLALATLTSDYDREITRLRTLIEQRRNQLDPTTVAIIERNLAVIDTAIAESRRAVAADPASRFLIHSLNQSLQTKVELMRTVAMLPSRS